jgi:phospholipid/cholesterol/gamma-HCH transport system permease protein
MNLLENLGSYLILMRQVITLPPRVYIFRRQLFTEIQNLGFDSMGIVAIISIFMGAVVTIQTAYNIDSPLIPLTMIGFTARQSVILEFAPTIISLILAGKVGSRIASEIGTMRVTQQIDALEVMGINSANYLILPKILASMIFNPVLIVLSISLSLFGGWMVAILTSLYTPHDYISGLRINFDGFTVFYALIKTVVFAYIIASVSGYQGYRISGGALEVGQASTRAVVHSSINIIVFNLILTQLLLT